MVSIYLARKSKKWKDFRLRMWIIKPHFCYLCGFPIPDNVHHTHPLFYQLDHIIPVHIHPEGLFEEENVMLTHQLCNKKKGDRRITKWLQESCQKEVEKILNAERNKNKEIKEQPEIPLDESGFF